MRVADYPKSRGYHKRDILRIGLVGGLALGCAALRPDAGLAQAIPLTIDGIVEAKEADLSFDEAALMALPQQSFTTTTTWTEGTLEFSGPALSDVLAFVGAGGGDLRLLAANNYEVTISRDLVEATAPIIATRINGKPFGLRENGPLWLVFPYDRETKYHSEDVYAASVWQLVSLTVLPD